MEFNTPLKIVVVLFTVGVLSSVVVGLFNSVVSALPISSLTVWGIITPGLTGYIYGKRYKRRIPKTLRIQSVSLYFCLLLLLGFVALIISTGSTIGQAIESSGILVAAAAAVSLITYLIFWLSGLNYDDP